MRLLDGVQERRLFWPFSDQHLCYKNRENTRNRGWIWFFVALALLSITAISILVLYNPTVPLTPAYSAEAKAKWKQRGPRDYDMDYTLKKIKAQSGSTPECGQRRRGFGSHE